ncbi:apelin [Sphaerodactylus townsendi]|uniref:apelin n=1 Tax=Sphaerodactylus townsendi TaxID=933632 RepID=UPI0020270299|nr:apelin [Sphaerodactylus townsendi]
MGGGAHRPGGGVLCRYGRRPCHRGGGGRRGDGWGAWRRPHDRAGCQPRRPVWVSPAVALPPARLPTNAAGPRRERVHSVLLLLLLLLQEAAAAALGGRMGVRRWLLALLLLWLALSSGSGGPLTETSEDGKEPREGHIRNLVHSKGVRSAAGYRPNGWRKYRRPRPRLSHKGPMPF